MLANEKLTTPFCVSQHRLLQALIDENPCTTFTQPPSAAPTFAPTEPPSPSTAAPAETAEACVDVAGWVDKDGMACRDYEKRRTTGAYSTTAQKLF